jgi:CubicO group peptidase (beta-lactamase class C family)
MLSTVGGETRMRKVRQIPLFLSALVAVLMAATGRADDLPRARPADVGLSAKKLERLDARFKQAIEDRQIPGAVVLIARKGKVAHLQAMGQADIEAGRPVKVDALFRIMSMTKAVTSVAAMMLVEEGKLRLDDPVSKYLPEMKGQQVLVPGKSNKADDYTLVPAEREPTIRDLLRHTSGLIYPGDHKQLTPLYRKARINSGFTQTTEKLEDNIKRLGKLPLAHQPGAQFTYGLSTDVLGRVVEVVSGQDLSRFFQERIFTPLQMKDTTFHPTAEQCKRLAALYRSEGKKLERVSKRDPSEEGSGNYFSGGAGLYSTTEDYARFLNMLLEGGQVGGTRLLRDTTIKQMIQSQLGEKSIDFGGVHGDTFGLGFGIVTRRSKDKTPMAPGSYSWAGAYYSYFWVDPSSDLFGVMMTQVQHSGDRKLWKDLAKLTYEAVED